MPAWLAGAKHVDGLIVEFIAGQNEKPAAVVKLDKAMSYQGASGDHVVLELRWAGATWTAPAIVHVTLCDAIREPVSRQDRDQWKCVESHATCDRIGNAIPDRIFKLFSWFTRF